MKQIPVETLRELFEYDENSGVLRRKKVQAGYSVGDIAGTKNPNGVLVRIGDTKYYAHRIAWAMKTGMWPSDCIDHKDGNPHNNSWANLRAATHQQNMRNYGIRAGAGVYENGARFSARISIAGKRRHLGTYDTREVAEWVYECVSKAVFGQFSPFLRG